MSPVSSVYSNRGVLVYQGDCIDIIQTMPSEFISAIVTDPPYSYRFMGRKWDAHDSPLAFQQWCEQWARECLRVLKPGGHLLAFGGTRTFHRLTCGVEDAGFRVRDSIDSTVHHVSWIYGQGMPKGINIGKAIDKMAGAEREVVGVDPDRAARLVNQTGAYVTDSGWSAGNRSADVTAPATDEPRQWEGWNTQLRPAHEPIVVARKPFPGTVAGNVLAHGTGAINVDACRVAAADGDYARPGNENRKHTDTAYGYCEHEGRQAFPHSGGRWPPNVVLSHVPSVDPATGEVVGDACAQGCVDGCPVRELDQQSGERPSGRPQNRFTKGDKFGGSTYGSGMDQCLGWAKSPGYVDSGGASRFFPCFRFEAKAPTAERPRVAGESHNTVKPLALMRWLLRLVTPPGGIVLDCFAGSGATGEAACIEGFPVVLIDSAPISLALTKTRLESHFDKSKSRR